MQATLDDAARRTDRGVASLAAEILTEGAKMRRVPGIVFADGVRARVAQITGTRLEVWEIIERYQATGNDWEILKQEFEWLTEPQLRAALSTPRPILRRSAARLSAEDHWTPATLYAAHPTMKPPVLYPFPADEDILYRLAIIARAHGLDVVSSLECRHNGLPDEEQLRLAAAEGRCLVTRNRDDFQALTLRFFENEWPHAGVLFVSRSLPNGDLAGMARALLAYADAHADGLPSYALGWLSAESG